MVAWLQPERFARVTSGIKVGGQRSRACSTGVGLEKERKIEFFFQLLPNLEDKGRKYLR